MTRARVFFYVQHLLGIGHLARANRISLALASQGFDVAMVTGGPEVPGFPDPSLGRIRLPSVTSADAGFSGLVDADGTPIDDAFKAARRDRLVDAFESTRPDIVLTEAFPFGRRQMRFELLPLLDAIAATRPRPLLLASIRDVLQSRAKPARNQETADTINTRYDGVLVHGDPDFIRLEASFPLTDQIASKLHYTGLVAPEATPPSDEPVDVLVSAGGGAVGIESTRTALVAARRLQDTLRWVLVAGPNLPEQDYAELAKEAAGLDNVALYRFRTDFNALMARTRVSVSRAGYNTVCDILRAGCRSVLVPFATGGETEQSVRAERLAARDRAEVITEDDLTADRMTEAIATELDRGGPFNGHPRLDGADETARILRGLLDRQRDA